MKAYENFKADGSIELNYFRLMIVGPEGVGKSCLLKALKGERFDEREISTNFIEKTDISIIDPNKEWGKSEDFIGHLQTTRDDIIAKIIAKNFKESSKSSDESKLDFSKEDDGKILKNLSVNKKFISDDSNSRPNTHSDQKQNFYSNKDCEDLRVLRKIQKHWTNEHMIDPMNFFTVWDLAGQSYLFCMQSLFLSPRAVYIVAVDLTKHLNEQIVRNKWRVRIEKRDEKLSYLEMINLWIQTIYSVAMSTENEECKSRIIIVFTKSDEIADPQATAARYFKEIRDSLFWKSNCMSIIDKKFHVVSAKDREREKFKMLRENIYENAKLITRFDSKIPIRWLKFALGITNSKQDSNTIKEIADETGCGMDYAQILEFFHSIGVFFFRKNILVKSLKSLLNVISYIVLPHKYDYYEISPGKFDEIKRGEEEEILSDRILDVILMINRSSLNKVDIVQLLKEFGIITCMECNISESFISLSKNSEKWNFQKYYNIPYLFTKVIPINPKDSDLVLYLYFPDGLAPTSFYFALLSLCISKCDKTKNSPKLGFNCVEFQWQNLTWIIDLLPDHKPYIRIIVRGIDFMNSCTDIHSLIFQLEQWTAHIQRELILSGKIAQIVLECPCKQFSEKRRPCVYLKNYLMHSVEETHFYCKNKNKFIPWAIYNNKLHHPFKKIPCELGEKFVKDNRDQIWEMLHVKPLLRPLHKKGLIDGKETDEICQLCGTKEVELLVNNISNKRNWAYQFYKILKNNEDQSNVEVRKLYEKFISEFKHSEIPVEEIGFIRYPIRNNPCGICLIINMRTFGGKMPERKGSEFDVSKLEKTFDNMSFKTFHS